MPCSSSTDSTVDDAGRLRPGGTGDDRSPQPAAANGRPTSTTGIPRLVRGDPRARRTAARRVRMLQGCRGRKKRTFAALQDRRFAGDLVFASGLMLVLWIAVQLAFIKTYSWFHPTYLAAAIVVLGLTGHGTRADSVAARRRTARRAGRWSHRSLGSTLGYRCADEEHGGVAAQPGPRGGPPAGGLTASARVLVRLIEKAWVGPPATISPTSGSGSAGARFTSTSSTSIDSGARPRWPRRRVRCCPTSTRTPPAPSSTVLRPGIGYRSSPSPPDQRLACRAEGPGTTPERFHRLGAE